MKDKSGKSLTQKQIVEKGKNRSITVAREFVVFLLHFVGIIPIHSIRRLCYTLAGITIGKGSAIHTRATFYNPSNISIGKDTIIGEGAVLDGRDTLSIGNHVDIASEVMIYNCQHNIHSPSFEAIPGKVIIDDYVFIGPRAILLPGTHIGYGAVVAAGAVVTKDVADFTIVGGVPAVVIGKRNIKDLNYTLGRAAWFR